MICRNCWDIWKLSAADGLERRENETVPLKRQGKETQEAVAGCIPPGTWHLSERKRLVCAQVHLRQLLWISEGILFAAVLECLKSAVPVISHGIAVIRRFRFRGFVQQNMEKRIWRFSGSLWFGFPFFFFQPGHTDNHLNRVHFEIGLKFNSVCSFNPSLDVYFNSVNIFYILYIGRLRGRIYTKQKI